MIVKLKSLLKKAFKGKSASFINENFDYTVKLFKKKESDRLETLKEEAYSDMEKVDVVYESATAEQPKPNSPYLDELSKY